MEADSITPGRSDSDSFNDRRQWQDTIQLLQSIQSDYQGVRRQLEYVGNSIIEKENKVKQYLQNTLLLSKGYQPLCLATYTNEGPVAQIGNAILGDIIYPETIQKSIRLKIRCLGKFETFSEWKKVEHWHSIKAKSVFQYLLTRPNRPVIKEVLMEMLWPDCNPRAASNNLKVAIHHLRHILTSVTESEKEFPCILFLQGSYMINPEITLWVDVDEFERHWTLGQRFEKENRVIEARHEYEMAEALYRGDYLEDESYEEWTILRREALSDTHLLILSKLADYSIKSADYDSCITYSLKILAKDPCREDAYRWIILCHSRLGQKNRALRWYEMCRHTIKTELDADLESETIALYHRVMNNDPV